jgi:nucleotide-binding universal stress UspA family protein
MKVLIALQDRLLTRELLPFLTQHNWVEPAEFEIMHIVDQPFMAYHVDIELHERIHQRAKELVDAVVDELQKAVPGAKISGFVVEGDPKEEIVKAAHAMPANLIIMGSHGRGLIGRMFLGSVSLAVHAAAPCSVLILRTHQTVKEKQSEKVAENVVISPSPA